MTPPTPYIDPPPVRRRFADELRRLATGRRFTPAERAELARMADAWGRTLDYTIYVDGHRHK